MARFASGKFAKAISDRSGLEFPYKEMVREWNGAYVHISEFEPKQPQLQPKATSADAQALNRVRPARKEFGTPLVLRDNPFSTTSGQVSVVVFISNDSEGIDNNPFQTNDAIRFTDVKLAVGGVSVDRFQLATTLSSNLNSTATTVSLTDASNFPSSGFIVIEKVDTEGHFVDETIQYTGKSSNDLTGCTRGTVAPLYGETRSSTTAGSHNSGAKVFGSYIITRRNNTMQDDAGGTITYSYDFSFSLASASSNNDVGGGTLVFAGPVNQRA